MRHLATATLILLCAIHGACTTDSSQPTAPTPPTSPTQYTIKFGTTAAGLDLSACNVVIPGGLCRRVLTPDATGEFHDTYEPSTAVGILNIDGKITSTAVTATIKCIMTTAAGSLSANVNGAEYLGTATLSGKTIPIRVLKGMSQTCQ